MGYAKKRKCIVWCVCYLGVLCFIVRLFFCICFFVWSLMRIFACKITCFKIVFV